MNMHALLSRNRKRTNKLYRRKQEIIKICLINPKMGGKINKYKGMQSNEVKVII